MNRSPVPDTPDELLTDALQFTGAGGIGQRLPGWLRVVHWAIIVNLLGQWLYGGWQVFVVLQPEGTIGPMFGNAVSLPYELMVARRMYALEAWVAFLGLAVYLGVTEILPRRASVS